MLANKTIRTVEVKTKSSSLFVCSKHNNNVLLNIKNGSTFILHVEYIKTKKEETTNLCS